MIYAKLKYCDRIETLRKRLKYFGIKMSLAKIMLLERAGRGGSY